MKKTKKPQREQPKNHPNGVNPRPRPRQFSDYDDDDETNAPTRAAGKRRDDDRADHRSGSGPNAAVKNANPEISKSSAAKSSGNPGKKVKRRDDGKSDANADDGPVSLRPGTKIEMRRIADLVRSPWQDIYDDLSDHDLKALAASVKKRLKQAVEILPENAAGLPPNTILDGCQRLAALELNGETEVEVEVRYDLAEADAATIELEFLAPNKERRQLGKLEKARVALRQYELEKNRKGGKLFACDKEKARELLGKEMGVSGKTLHRHWSALQAPIEVQRAYTAKKLGIVPAARVATLNAKDQEQIARRIRDGENPKTVVEEFFPTPSAGHVKPADAVASYVKSLVRGYDDLSGRIDEVRPSHVRKHVEDMKRARRLIRQLLAIAEPENVAR